LTNELPPITEAEVLRRLRREADLQGGLRALAYTWGLPHSTLSRVLAGRLHVTPKIAKLLRLIRHEFLIYRFEEAHAQNRHRLSAR